VDDAYVVQAVVQATSCTLFASLYVLIVTFAFRLVQTLYVHCITFGLEFATNARLNLNLMHVRCWVGYACVHFMLAAVRYVGRCALRKCFTELPSYSESYRLCALCILLHSRRHADRPSPSVCLYEREYCTALLSLCGLTDPTVSCSLPLYFVTV
jgi:hypothetical protein